VNVPAEPSAATAARAGGKPWRALTLGAGAIVLGLVELAAQVWAARRAPSLVEWQALAPEVAKRVTAGGDLVLIAPSWAEPNARFALGDALMPLEHVARAEERGFARALEIGVVGQQLDALAGWRELRRERVGKFSFRILENPEYAPVLYDFLDHLSALEASVATGGPAGVRTACPFGTNFPVTNGDLFGHPTFPRDRFRCPGGGDWFFVGKTVIEDQEYRPRRCIWAHPSEAGPQVIRFENVPLGSELRAQAGLPYFFERETHGAPVELAVLVGETVTRFEHLDGQGWSHYRVDTRQWAGQSLPVEFHILTKKARRREFCFHAATHQ
jgi:hypothetical protein